MFICEKCNKEMLEYSGRGIFKCKNCGNVEVEQGKECRCPCCGESYYAYTWFDPSGCPRCHKTFID